MYREDYARTVKLILPHLMSYGPLPEVIAVPLLLRIKPHHHVTPKTVFKRVPRSLTQGRYLLSEEYR